MNFVKAITNGSVEFAKGFWTAFLISSPLFGILILLGYFLGELF